MKTIETIATVTDDGTLIVRVPPDVPPGEHAVVVVIDAPATGDQPREPLRLKVGRLPGWPADARFRREEMYGDDGR